jgi:hypothetical protein
MSFKSVDMDLRIDCQIVTFYPDSTAKLTSKILDVVRAELKKLGRDEDFLVGWARVTIGEEK